MATTRPIDQKIVAMKMDNSDFIQKAAETTKSMGALTRFLNKIPGVNIGKATSELQNIQKSVNGIDPSKLSGALDAVTSKFSTLGIVGVTALANITNRIVDAGAKMLKSFTTDPIMSGFNEYELKMGSIQTILANTTKHGTKLSDVTAALDELNKYADRTIYNFGDMTKNIGLFTNAGLKLEESVSMIKGFSNAAAASGTNAERMAGAAYQLSQGLSSAYLMQMDWMSLTNAGMGNDNMKRDLIALGQAMGTLKESTESTMVNWKDFLSDKKWLTKEVMSKYLQTMAGDLDKATLLTIGLTEAQADLMLQNAKIGNDSAVMVRTFTQMVGTIAESVGSGWSESFEIMFGGFEEATQLWTGFSEILGAPFQTMTESRNKMLQSLKDAGVFEELLTTIGTAIYLIGQGINAVTSGFDKAFSSGRLDFIMSLVDGFKRLVFALAPSQEELANISTIFQAVGSTVRVAMKYIGELGKFLFGLIPDDLRPNILGFLADIAKTIITFNEALLSGKSFTGALDNLGGRFSWIAKRLDFVGGGFKNFGSVMSEIWETMKTGKSVVNGVFDSDSKIVSWLTSIGNAAKSVIKYVKEMNVSLTPIADAFNDFFSAIGIGFNWLKDRLSGIKEAISGSMPSGTELLAGGFIAGMVTITGVVTKWVYDVSKIFSGWGNTVQAFADTLDSVSGALDSFALTLKAKALLTASVAVGALALSIMMLSRVDGSKIGSSLTAMVVSLAAVVGAMAIINKFDITGGLRASLSIIAIGVAMTIIAGALQKFADMKPEELTKGLITLVVVMGSLAGAFALMGKFSGGPTGAASAMQIVAMSASMLIIAKAIKQMGTMKQSELIQGISGMTAIILAISGAFILMGKFSGAGASATAAQFIAIAGSVVILVAAIKMISAIETNDLLIGLGTITLILAAVAGFAALTSGKGLLSSAVGLLAISVAMNALLVPIFAIGNFPLDTLIIGLVGMSAALFAIAAASMLMKSSIGGALSITVMAVALNLLLIPITAFATMGWGPMLTAIAGLGLSLAVLGGVALLLSAAVVPLLGFAAAIGLLGLAMLAAGAGFALFGTGLVALAGLSGAAIATIITTLGALITGIAALAPKIAEFVGDIMIKVWSVILEKAPIIIGVIGDTILAIMAKIEEYIPLVVAAGVKIYTSLLDAIAEEAPKLIESAVNLLITLVQTMATTVEEKGPIFVNAFLDLFSEIIQLVIQSGTAVIESLLGWVPGVKKAMNNVAENATEAIEESFDAAKIGEEKGEEFAEGVRKTTRRAKEASKEVTESAEEGLESKKSWSLGSIFGGNFLGGILSRKSDAKQAASEMAGAAADGVDETLQINSPSLVGGEQGEFYGAGLIYGVNASMSGVTNAGENLAGGLVGSLGDTYNMIKDKLFLKKTDVDENKTQANAVVDTYSGASDKIDKKTKSAGKAAVKSKKDLLKEAFEASKAWIEDRKYFQLMSLEEELRAWERLQKRYKVGTEQRKEIDREVFRVQQEIIKDNFNTSKEWIDERKYYNKLSLDEELRAWKRVQKEYKKGSEEQKQAAREVYRVEQELIAKKDNDRKEALSKSKSYIEDLKTFNNISLTAELKAWERVQKKYKEGTDERKEADREVLRVKNEINSRLIALNEDYVSRVKDANQRLIEEEKRLNDEYKQTYDDRVKSLSNFVGLFDKIKEKDAENPVNGKDLVENLRGQVNSLATWSDDLQRLAQKGMDAGLLKELQEMGPNAAIEIEALNGLTAAQLDEYVALWKKKTELASTQATRELAPLREETDKNIAQLRTDTEKQLEEYRKEWVKKITEIRVGTSAQFVGLNDDMQSIGEDAIKGLTKGLDDKKAPLYAKVQEIALGIEKTIKDTLKIKSPSKVLEGLGWFAGEGLANGLWKASGLVGDKSRDLASKAQESINKFLATFQAPEFENEIHFKAILDDSEITKANINRKIASISQYLGTTNGLATSAKAGLRQNGNKTTTEPNKTPSTDSSIEPNLNRPIVIQSVLNGKVIAEETFNDISQLISGRTNLDYVMRGV